MKWQNRFCSFRGSKRTGRKKMVWILLTHFVSQKEQSLFVLFSLFYYSSYYHLCGWIPGLQKSGGKFKKEVRQKESIKRGDEANRDAGSPSATSVTKHTQWMELPQQKSRGARETEATGSPAWAKGPRTQENLSTVTAASCNFWMLVDYYTLCSDIELNLKELVY